MEKTLLLGAGGFLASEILKNRKDIIALSKDQCDITSRSQVLEVINKYNPSIIINCAAITNLEYCEQNQIEAWKVNVIGVRNISEAARNKSIYLVHFSSDYALDPKNEYSWTKLVSEFIVNGLVIRTNFYNDSHWLFQKLLKNENVNLLENILFNPITTISLIDYMNKLIEKRFYGIINVGSKDKISYYDFGVLLCNVFGFNKKLIKPVKSINLSYDYPKNTYLDLNELEKLGFPILSAKEDMELLKNGLKQ